MKIILTILFLIIAFTISCGTGYLVNLNEPTNFPEGRRLFISKCNGCHKFHNPSEFTIAQWDSILIPMKLKAKLSEDQKDSIFGWISEKIINDKAQNKN
jgi:hypothetical protein